MKLVNFSILSSIELEVQNKVIDLHNLYKLHRVSYFSSGELEIEFRWDYLERTEPAQNVLLSLKHIDYMKITGTLKNDSSLDEMGFKEEDEVDEDFVSDAEYNFPTSHFLLYFFPMFSIRVRAQEATVSISS